MKKILTAFGVLIVLVLVAVIAVFVFIDTIARAAVEKGSTIALGVPTTLSSADVKVFAGEFEMSGLQVNNPPDFKSPHFLQLNNAGVAVTLGSIMQDTVELPHLKLTGIDVNLEKNKGKSNYKVILEHLKQFESDDPAEGKRFVVTLLEVRDVKVHVDMMGAGDLSKVHVPIDEIKLENVGSDTEHGVLLAELTGVIIKAIFAAAVQKGGEIIPDDMLGELTGALGELESLGQIADIGGLSDFGMNTVGDVANKAGELGDKAKEGAGKVIGELGNLLGGDKKDSP